jgi:hypothetical protein
MTDQSRIERRPLGVFARVAIGTVAALLVPPFILLAVAPVMLVLMPVAFVAIPFLLVAFGREAGDAVNARRAPHRLRSPRAATTL